MAEADERFFAVLFEIYLDLKERGIDLKDIEAEPEKWYN